MELHKITGRIVYTLSPVINIILLQVVDLFKMETLKIYQGFMAKIIIVLFKLYYILLNKLILEMSNFQTT